MAVGDWKRHAEHVTFDDVLDARAVNWPTLNGCVLAYVRSKLEGSSWSLVLGSQDDDDATWHEGLGLHAHQIGWFRLNGYFCTRDQSLLMARAYLVPSISRQFLTRIAADRKLDVVLFGDERDHVHAIRPAPEREIGPYHPGLVAQLCSEALGPDLQFLGFDFPPQHWIQAMKALASRQRRDLPTLPPLP